MKELIAVIDFALEHQGQDWHISSIESFHYQDTGEWLHNVNMIRKSEIDRPGQTQARLLFSQKDNTLQARPVRMHRTALHGHARKERQRLAGIYR